MDARLSAETAFVGTSADVTLVATVSSGAVVQEVRVDGETRLFTNGAPARDSDYTFELPLGSISFASDAPVEVEVIFEGDEGRPSNLVLNPAPNGSFRPRRLP